MFWFHTLILNDAPIGYFCPSNGPTKIVVSAELEPDELNVVTDEGFVDDSGNIGTWSKDIHDVDFLHVGEPIVGRSSQNLPYVGTDGDNIVAVRLEIFRDFVGVLSRR